MARQITTASLYNGDVLIDFHWDDEDPKVHYYTLHGDKKRLMGVTNINSVISKDMLTPWAVKLACDHIQGVVDLGIQVTTEHINVARSKYRATRDEAADIGKKVHKWVEDYINGQNPVQPKDEPRVLNGISAFLQWINQHDVKFISTEKILYSKKYGYVGTLDAEAIIDGKLCLIDFKTTKKPRCKKCEDQKICKHPTVYVDWLLQTAAYQKAREEEGVVKYKGPRKILRFDKETGNFQIITLKGIRKDFSAFLSAQNLKKRCREVEAQ